MTVDDSNLTGPPKVRRHLNVLHRQPAQDENNDDIEGIEPTQCISNMHQR